MDLPHELFVRNHDTNTIHFEGATKGLVFKSYCIQALAWAPPSSVGTLAIMIQACLMGTNPTRATVKVLKYILN
jgi:hypothetical protein